MPSTDWIFWKITEPESGELVWLGITGSGRRTRTVRDRMRTLIPRGRVFVANWYVTEDYLESPGGRWAFENVDVSEARELLPELPDPSPEDVARITRPESCFTVEEIDRFEVLKVMGKTAQSVLLSRR